MQDWVSFWDSDHPIYVNARHFDVHYRAVAADIVRLLPSAEARVLDHGCGEALHADAVAAQCGGLLLCEAAPSVRARVAARFADAPKIRVIGPHEVARLPEACLDLVVANSLVQYLKRSELEALLADWRRLHGNSRRERSADKSRGEENSFEPHGESRKKSDAGARAAL